MQPIAKRRRGGTLGLKELAKQDKQQAIRTKLNKTVDAVLLLVANGHKISGRIKLSKLDAARLPVGLVRAVYRLCGYDAEIVNHDDYANGYLVYGRPKEAQAA